jgi:hypothetical protein
MEEEGNALDWLQRAADALLAEGVRYAADERFLARFRTQLNRCELAFALATRPLVQRCREDDGYSDLSPTEILRHDCKMASGPAGTAVQVGEMAELLPKSREALEAGRIGLAHLTLIAYTAEFVGEGFREDARLAKAEKLPVTSFARACTHYRHAANPEAFTQEERHAHEERFVELTTNAENGSVWLRGFLDAEGGAHLKTAIDALAQPLPQDDRTAGQRRAWIGVPAVGGECPCAGGGQPGRA